MLGNNNMNFHIVKILHSSLMHGLKKKLIAYLHVYAYFRRNLDTAYSMALRKVDEGHIAGIPVQILQYMVPPG